MPSLLRLSTDSIQPEGMYLAENGVQVMMWVGSDVKPEFIKQMFGLHSLHDVQMQPLSNPEFAQED